MLHCPRKIMRTITYFGILLATGLVTAFATSLTPALAADPTGDWRVQDGVANIRVAECNGSMWGVVSGKKSRRPRQEQSRCLKTEQTDAGHADPARHEEDGRRRSMGRPSLQRQGRPDLQFHDQARRSRPARNPGLRAGLPVRRRDLDPGRGSDSLEPRQQHGQGRAEDHGRAAQDRCSRAESRAAAPAAKRQVTPQRRRTPGRRPSAISAYSPTSRGLPISAG